MAFTKEQQAAIDSLAIEKKAIELSDSEKAILEILKPIKSIKLADLKEKSGLSNKQWDKGSTNEDLVPVEVFHR